MLPNPFEGKTYSLYGDETTTEHYYNSVRRVTDLCLAHRVNLSDLLCLVQRASRNRRRLRNLAVSPPDCSIESFLVHTARSNFSSLTKNVASHLCGLTFSQRRDSILTTSEEQYHLYAVEIELTNRLHAPAFRMCGAKLAFLPHCLRDLTADCRSAKRGVDYVCKGCSNFCTINAVTKLLRRHGVMPYIWRTADLQPLFRRLQTDGLSLGVVGVACIPELVRGMRMCARSGIPVIGVPLDTNRCVRWWGEFHPNTVNMTELEVLLGEETRKKPGPKHDQCSIVPS
jgi:hypothetical protein